MQKLINFTLIIFFFSIQAQKKDTIYISYVFSDSIPREITYEAYPNSDFLHRVHKYIQNRKLRGHDLHDLLHKRKFTKTYSKKGKENPRDFWVFYFGSESYFFYHEINKHRKKELSQSEVQKLKVLQVPVILSETLEEAYPGFNEKADAFYHSKEQEEKREASMKKKAKKNNNQGFTRVVIPYVPPPTYLTFCQFYIVETTAEGRYFLYEVACAYDPYAPYE